MKIRAYIRCSTDKQDEASQRQIITTAPPSVCAAPNEWISDFASGGIPWQERQIAAVLEQSAAGDVIVVSEVSRIARSTVGVLTFLQEAARRKVCVVAVKSGIRLDNSITAKIVVTVFAMAAEIDRDLLRERTKAALQARKLKGLTIGRQPGAVGKKNKLDGRLPEIQPLLDAKVPKAAIARILNVSRPTLNAFLDSQQVAP